MVVVLKSDGDVKIYVDMHDLIERTVFSKVDIKWGFHLLSKKAEILRPLCPIVVYIVTSDFCLA